MFPDSVGDGQKNKGKNNKSIGEVSNGSQGHRCSSVIIFFNSILDNLKRANFANAVGSANTRDTIYNGEWV